MAEAALAQRCAVVTGAGSGIGRAIAKRLAAAGARVVVADLNREGAAQTVEAIIAAGGEAQVEICNVTQSSEVEQLFDRAESAYGPLRVLVNNVGFTLGGLLDTVSDPDWERVLAGNLSATFYGVRAALQRMVPQRQGSIVNISSGAGLFGSPGMGAYAACKAGVINLTKTAAVEQAGSGVRVNCVIPGAIATPAMLAWAEHQAGGRAAYEQRLTPGRMGEPEEIAAAVYFLASDEASYVNGAALLVDGGANARMPTSIE